MRHESGLLLAGMRTAGQAIQMLQQNGFSIERKANNDLLTQADLTANHILREHLSKHFPAVGWLSEESVDDLSRLTQDMVFVVDPIDGTIEFARGIPEYAISVALLEHGKPVLASVYNPATEELFLAEKGQGASLNDKKIQCVTVSTHPEEADPVHPEERTKCASRRTYPQPFETHAARAPQGERAHHLTLLASRSEDKRGEWDRFKPQHDVKIVGSIAYKLALVAAGKAHATFSLGPKNEWDIAAGVLLVQEAGGKATTQTNKEFTFNQRHTLVEGIVASSADLHDFILALIH